MHHSFRTLAAAATLGLMASAAQAMPVSSSAIRDAVDAIDPVEQAAVYIVEGRRYCFYFNGWHGAGWYRCGFAWRRGLGWGGVYGWQGWTYGPAARRFGADVTIRERTREGSRTREDFEDSRRLSQPRHGWRQHPAAGWNQRSRRCHHQRHYHRPQRHHDPRGHRQQRWKPRR